jgi:uncharacterized repeat protein (TIGR03803 family)
MKKVFTIRVSSLFLLCVCIGGINNSANSMNIVNNNSTSNTFSTTTQYKYSIVYTFPGGDGSGRPDDGLIQGPDGNLYGTASGSIVNDGSIFKISPSGAESIFYSFWGGTDGANPDASLIIDKDGNLLGTTYGGGDYSYGAVFKITLNGLETILYSFMYGSDGSFPSSSLLQDTDGSLYGTTQFGGTEYDHGTVFKIASDGTESIVYRFLGNSDGGTPYAALIKGTDGNFYGTIATDDNFHGKVFKITPNGSESIVYSFQGESDGSNPYSALIQGTDGNFYGTTEYGGSINNYGTIFKITPNGKESILYRFQGGSDGANPYAGLIQGTDGNFYGTTVMGGDSNYGTVFKITPNGTESVLYSFKGGSDGSNPYGTLLQTTDGNFYGTTVMGGSFNYGIVFKITQSQPTQN